jgi:UDP-4-amino-4,6-dideoxy-N-acetyl-beta-L-altrosamine transaminase
MAFLPYGRQEISDADVDAVSRALRDPMLTQGPGVERFEAALAEFAGSEYAVAFNSCTAALHASYAALGVGPGTAVLTSPITFAATANAALYLGGEVRFADVDPATALIDPDDADNRGEKPIKVIAPVHFAGEVAPMEVLAAIAEARGWRIVEDAAHAIGARYRTSDGGSHRVGACDHSDICCFSFHPVKQMTTGEGGAATTNDPDLHRRLKRFRSHGITREPGEMIGNDGPWYYEQHELGFNYRLTDFQCALGRSQLGRLPGWIEARARVAGWYRERLAEVAGVEPLEQPRWSQGAHHLFVVRMAPERRRAGYDALVAAGIGANVHYVPVYRHPYYRRHGFDTAFRPAAEGYYASAITLPLFPAMTEQDVDRVVDVLRPVASGVGSR